MMTDSEHEDAWCFRSEQHDVGLARLNALQKDENSCPNMGNLGILMSNSFKQMIKLKSMVLTIWQEGDHGQRRFFDR